MKTSTTLVTMTITMLLLALQSGAADYKLGIFGNANGGRDDQHPGCDVHQKEEE